MIKVNATVKIESNKLGILMKSAEERVTQVLRASALKIEALAKTKVPVRTGNLKNSLHSEVLKWDTAVVGTHVEYAPYVEFGTRKMSARPFFVPAVEAVVPEFKQAIQKVLE